jgi:hypothetical protein
MVRCMFPQAFEAAGLRRRRSVRWQHRRARGFSVASLVAGPGRLSRRGHTKSSARPGGATIGSPLTSTGVVIESVKGGLSLSPSSESGGILGLSTPPLAQRTVRLVTVCRELAFAVAPARGASPRSAGRASSAGAPARRNDRALARTGFGEINAVACPQAAALALEIRASGTTARATPSGPFATWDNLAHQKRAPAPTRPSGKLGTDADQLLLGAIGMVAADK